MQELTNGPYGVRARRELVHVAVHAEYTPSARTGTHGARRVAGDVPDHSTLLAVSPLCVEQTDQDGA